MTNPKKLAYEPPSILTHHKDLLITVVRNTDLLDSIFVFDERKMMDIELYPHIISLYKDAIRRLSK